MKKQIQKLYCFVDETGQDAGSNLFIVVTVIAWNDVRRLRLNLIELEKRLKIGSKKWHKLRPSSRTEFINAFLRIKCDDLKIYFGRFKKPVPYFFPTLEVIQRSLMSFPKPMEAVVSIDGLDAVSSKKMTNALRSKHLHLKLVKGWRDESEVLIRLADRFAGCLRQAFLDYNEECKKLILRAEKNGILKEV